MRYHNRRAFGHEERGTRAENLPGGISTVARRYAPVGGALLLLGALTRVVVALHILVMIGAAAFVHISHGLFAQDGGWELVGVIAACELVLAGTGAGRFSIDYLVHRGRQARAMPPTTAAPAPAPAPALPERVHEPVTLPSQPTAPFGDGQWFRGGPGGPMRQPGDRDQTPFDDG